VNNLIKASLVALAMLAFGVSAQPTRPHPIKPPFPQLELTEKARGERAVQLLGGRLPEVAAWYGKSPDEFAAILRRDQKAWIDRSGRMYYEEELEAPLQAGTATGDSLTLTGGVAPLDQTFKLHSRPGAKRTIYLNFVGATLTNTVWNTSTQPSITALPFDLDGVPYSFSSNELERIQMIWQRVAEDYAPFEVNVTTEPPASGALTRSSTSDDTFGTWVLITKNTFYSCNCGGVAYLGIFDDTTDYRKPALVFYDGLGGGNEKYVAEAISHEAGHNMGLHHDGTSTSGYYTGHNGWAPIMGVGYYQSLVQWSRGEYPNANNKEDDYTVMAANGLPLRGDDHGNTTGSATTLKSSTASGVTTLIGGGFIERSTDVDVFSFVAGAGTISIAVNPAARSANLDLQADLMDGNGKVLATANPVDALNGALSFTTSSSGTFFVAVRGTGRGDLTTGYSNYGSLGEYRISGSVSASASQPPVAALSANPASGVAPLAVSFSASGSYDPDGTIASYEWNFGDGSAPAYGVTANRTYSNVGSYTATLKVTDNSGLTATRIVTISAESAVVTVPMSVAGVTVTLKTSKSGHAEAVADVLVKDGNGKAVEGATVTGTWSGVVSGSASGITNTTGVTSIKSPRTKTKGTFTFTVTGVVREGYLYTPTSNIESSDSATR
jgi:PKD repeat protein